MATAYILINCDIGFERSVIEKLKSIKEVDEVHVISGAYEVIAKIECADKDRIREIIAWKIHKIPCIRTTLTLLTTKE